MNPCYFKYFTIRKHFPDRRGVASRQTNQPDIAARDSEVARENCTVLTNSAEIWR
jgi:hypothetical protein